MWKQQSLQLDPATKRVLDDNLNGRATPFDLSVSGIKIGVHNWSHGIEENSGRYLSPENAIKAIMAKMTDFADPCRPQGVQDVVVIIVSHSDIEPFITTLESVMLLLPEPTFRQALDYAKASKDLEKSKMVKTPQISSPAFGNVADITPQAGRMLQNIMQNVVASNTMLADPFEVIAQLQQRKAERQAENQQNVLRLLNARAVVQAFQARGELATIAPQMLQSCPQPHHTFTTAICFIGQDLSQIKGMLQNVHY